MKTSVSNLWYRGTEYTLKICKLVRNIYWKELLLSSFWKELLLSSDKITDSQIAIKELSPFEYIWYYARIRINKASVFLKQCFNNGMVRIVDFFDKESNFATYESIINSNVKTNYIE